MKKLLLIILVFSLSSFTMQDAVDAVAAVAIQIPVDRMKKLLKRANVQKIK